MMGFLRTGLYLVLLCFVGTVAVADDAIFSKEEINTILGLGPWPPTAQNDPSNKVSGDKNAIDLGREIFFSERFSKDNETSCATCHEPENAFTERKPRSELETRLDRNTQSLINVKYQRWFGWDGSNDNLWAQSFAPLKKTNEMDLGAAKLREVLNSREFEAKYDRNFGKVNNHSDDMMFVNVGKALAAYIETLTTGKAPFDLYRDALKNNETTSYSEPAKRGLKIFVGKGNCTFCHSGPLFSNGEFHDAGVPYFVEAGRVDTGRHGGIKNLRTNRFTLDGEFTDDLEKTGAWKTRLVRDQHSDFGTFRVPSLRSVARTAPYMHDGRLSTLTDVVDHYSNIDLERLHADGEVILKPLHLTPHETSDLVAFLNSLTAADPEF
jgi:cytochrome c peroxidase